MRDRPRVAIVHYHLRPGGVTEVIRRVTTALRPHDVPTLVLCGVPPPEKNLPFPWRGVEGLAYDGHVPGKVLADSMQQAARDVWGAPPDIWHIHNHAVGKSSALPQAVQELARRGCPMVLQIHDFAEDGRPANYRKLTEELGIEDAARLGQMLYPQAPHIHYALLNARDRGRLIRSGVNAERAHLLPNAIATGISPPAHPTAPPQDPLIIYPTRAIRRKNMGEFLLWATIAKPGSRWATTLAPTHPVDLKAYRRWQTLAAEWRLPVEFELGIREPMPMSERMARAAGVITTSVAEGFGFSFLEPWLAGCPLMGRDLPDITVDFKREGVRLDHMYNRLDIPVAFIGGEDRLRAAFQRGLQDTFEAYGRTMPPHALEECLAATLCNGCVDFGRLDENLQEAAIHLLRTDPAARQALRPLVLRRPDAADATANAHAVMSAYSLERQGHLLLDLYRVTMASPIGPVEGIHAEALLDEFLNPRDFSLLRT